MQAPDKALLLDSLSDKVSVITEQMAPFFVQNCIACMYDMHHSSGVIMAVKFEDKMHEYKIEWKGLFDENLKKSYMDQNKKVDFGAQTIALLLVKDLAKYDAVEQTQLGTTVDYWLVGDDETYIFDNGARLEISGILKESDTNTVKSRIKQKVKRLKPGLKTYIIIVEFSNPRSSMVVING